MHGKGLQQPEHTAGKLRDDSGSPDPAITTRFIKKVVISLISKVKRASVS